MTVGFVESFHTFVDGFIYNNSNINASYQWQAICAPSNSASAAAVGSNHRQAKQMKVAAFHRLRLR